MTIEYMLVLLLSCLFQVVIVQQALKIVSKKCYIKKLSEVCAYIAYVSGQVINLIFMENVMIGIAFSTFLIFIIAMIYEIDIIKRIIFPIIVSSLFMLSELFMGLLVTSLTSMSIEQTQGNIYFYMQGVIGSKLLVFFIILAGKQFISGRNAKLSIAMTLNMCILPAAVNVILFAISELMVYNTNKTLSIVMTTGVVAFLLSIIVLMYSIEKNISDRIRRNELEYYNNEMKKQLSSVTSLIEKYKFSNKNMHDMKNKLLALKGMSNNINFENELREVNNILDCAKNIVYTSITGLDAILNEKLNIMTTLGIKFDSKIIVSDLEVDEMKLSILMANLLDNAIEESERLVLKEDDSSIKIDMIRIENQLHIKVANSKRNIECKQKTSKNDKYKHGYGTQIIDDLVKELNGVISREISENEYIAKVMIVI